MEHTPISKVVKYYYLEMHAFEVLQMKWMNWCYSKSMINVENTDHGWS
jgi:hypothetical protein